jgi:hypothetical protein
MVTYFPVIKKPRSARCWWFKLVILATWEAKIRRITVRSQSGKKLMRSPSAKPLEPKKKK